MGMTFVTVSVTQLVWNSSTKTFLCILTSTRLVIYRSVQLVRVRFRSTVNAGIEHSRQKERTRNRAGKTLFLLIQFNKKQHTECQNRGSMIQFIKRSSFSISY